MTFSGRTIGLAALAVLVAGLLAAEFAPVQTAGLRASFARPKAIPFPEHNPYSEAKAALGRELFFDAALSGNNVRSCGTCHQPSLGWSDGLPRAVGENDKVMALRSPSLIDIAFVDTPLGWDGKFPDLESVAFAPLLSPANMNITEAELISRLSKNEAYVASFRRAFGDGEITRRKIELALATFQRTIVAGEAPFDRWIMGNETAISPSAKRGFALFNGKANCANCHSGPSFTDGSFHDIGTAAKDDIGRGRLFPKSEKLQHAFKTPTLRDVALRPPYMHDGSLTTLEAVMDLYDKGGVDRPSRSPDIRPLGLTAAEKADIIAFMQTLTASTPAKFKPTAAAR